MSGHDLARLLVLSFLLDLIKKQILCNFLILSSADVKKKAANKNPKYILYVFGGSTHSVFTLWVLILSTTSFMWLSVLSRSEVSNSQKGEIEYENLMR